MEKAPKCERDFDLAVILVSRTIPNASHLHVRTHWVKTIRRKIGFIGIVARYTFTTHLKRNIRITVVTPNATTKK